MASSSLPTLTVGYVPGVTPAKWARTWSQRHPEVSLQLHPVAAAEAVGALRAGTVDVALLRPPADTSGMAVIGLYEETTVVVVPTDHLLGAVGAVDAVTVADLQDEPILIPRDDVVGWAAAPGVQVAHRPETTKDAIELVAAGTGVLIVPQSLARLHHRKDLVYRPIADAPTSPVALAVGEGRQPASVEEFIGIVRGRTAGSSRGAEPTPKRTAREKTRAKQAARAAAGQVTRKTGRPERGRR